MNRKYLLIIIVSFLFISCSTLKNNYDTQNEKRESGKYSPNANYEYLVGSTVWQLSSESKALMIQAFSLAKSKVDDMINKCNDRNNLDWNYIKENGKEIMKYKGQNVAIITDVDDTLVDGAMYTANIINKDGDYNNAAFVRFVLSDRCQALPLAVSFINYCVDNGIEVFYITNRSDIAYKKGQKDSRSGYKENELGEYIDKSGKELGTSIYQEFGKSFYDISIESMKKLGFPIDDKHLILNDSKLYGSSKTKAREAIINGCNNFPNGQREKNCSGSASEISCLAHYVPLMLGDNINDFTDNFSSIGAVERIQLTENYSKYFGQEWIVLPNAVYGDSMNAASSYGFNKLLEDYDYLQ